MPFAAGGAFRAVYHNQSKSKVKKVAKSGVVTPWERLWVIAINRFRYLAAFLPLWSILAANNDPRPTIIIQGAVCSASIQYSLSINLNVLGINTIILLYF